MTRGRRSAWVTLGLVLLLAGLVDRAEGGWRRRAKVAEGLTWEALAHDGAERRFGWYAGAGLGTDPAPVVLVLHGGGGRAAQVWSGDDGRAWRRLADEHGLVLLLPEGRSDPGKPDNHHWNDCRTGVLEPGLATDADDVGFLRAAVEWAAARWPVDRERVYVTGASNGGMMTFRMAMEAHDLVAAAAAIIANLPDPGECRGPVRPMPVLIMNGTDDPLMPWDGGCVAGPQCERGTVRSTADTVSFWVGVDRAASEPTCDLSAAKVAAASARAQRLRSHRSRKCSGFRARHPACVRRRCSCRRSGRKDVICRAPTRRSGMNHLRHTQHGFFLIHHAVADPQPANDHGDPANSPLGHFSRAPVCRFSRALKRHASTGSRRAPLAFGCIGALGA